MLRRGLRLCRLLCALRVCGCVRVGSLFCVACTYYVAAVVLLLCRLSPVSGEMAVMSRGCTREFRGTQDPVEAHAWLKELEKAFALTNVGDNQKVEYAKYFLKGESNYWWESAKALEATEVITWDKFKRMFLDKYFPRYMQTQMEMKFFELKQDNMTVREYEKKFTELSRFMGEYVDSEEKREKRFQQGLKPWLRSRVASFELTTYAEVV
ncbi:uncharacterized protein LOC141718992 [Apium graveolens]|uniref:uncharacterized protein LOC141718992 n=1 Tax=Apium graveolens TaxID=4045 RepID=UPI003D795157